MTALPPGLTSSRPHLYPALAPSPCFGGGYGRDRGYMGGPLARGLVLERWTVYSSSQDQLGVSWILPLGVGSIVRRPFGEKIEPYWRLY